MNKCEWRQEYNYSASKPKAANDFNTKWHKIE